MKLFIPERNTKLRLTRSHSFAIPFSTYGANRKALQVLVPALMKEYDEAQRKAQALSFRYDTVPNPNYNPNYVRPTYSWGNDAYYSSPTHQKYVSLTHTQEYKDQVAKMKAIEAKFGKDYKFPKGTILIVDKVYIAPNKRHKSTMSFRIRTGTGKKKKCIRFSVPLDDANKMNVMVHVDPPAQPAPSKPSGCLIGPAAPIVTVTAVAAPAVTTPVLQTINAATGTLLPQS